MKITSILRATALALATLSTSFAGGEGWTHDWDAAKQQAAKEHKDLLLDFTGSDWCGWCIKLNKEVFQQDAFKTGVKDKFVLVELDFPRDTSKLSAETQAQNKKLAEQFAIEGYPTIMLCDATGKAFAKTGYQAGGPDSYVKNLEKLREAKTTRDTEFAAAEAAKDDSEKAKHLVAGLKAMDAELVDRQYADVIEKIKGLDKSDSTGFVKERTEAIAKKEAEEKIGKALQSFMRDKIMPLMQAKEFDKAYSEITEYIKTNPGLPDDTKVQLHLNFGLPRFIEKGDTEAANKFVDEVAAMFPNHEFAKHTDQMKEKVKAAIGQMKTTNSGAEKAADKPKTGEDK